MPKTKSSNESTAETLWEDLGFTPEEAAVMELKYALLREITKEVERRKLTPKQLAQVLDIQQPLVSKLLNRKVSDISNDRLTKYLCRLGRTIKVTTKKAPAIASEQVA